MRPPVRARSENQLQCVSYGHKRLDFLRGMSRQCYHTIVLAMVRQSGVHGEGR